MAIGNTLHLKANTHKSGKERSYMALTMCVGEGIQCDTDNAK